MMVAATQGIIEGVGFYIVDPEGYLLLIKKPSKNDLGSTSGRNLLWKLVGTTEQCIHKHNLTDKENSAKQILFDETPFMKDFTSACHYVGNWLYTGDKGVFLFDNFVVKTRFIFRENAKTIAKQKGKNNINDIHYFHLLELPIAELFKLTADCLKVILFHKPELIASTRIGRSDIEYFNKIVEDNSRFFLYDKIPGGTYGAIYKALDISTLSARALKIAVPKFDDDKWRERFILEGTTLMRMRPLSKSLERGIERIFSINKAGDVTDGQYFLVKNWVRGKTLEAEFNEEGRKNLSDNLIIDIMRRVIRTLHGIHSLNKPVCHRDLKPNNIMILLDRHRRNIENLTIIDFGLCKDESVLIGTESGVQIGNAIYQSINTIRNYNKHNVMDDYYSALHIFHFLLFGKSFYSQKRDLVKQKKEKGKDTFIEKNATDFNNARWPESTKLFRELFTIVKENNNVIGNAAEEKKVINRIWDLFKKRS